MVMLALLPIPYCYYCPVNDSHFKLYAIPNIHSRLFYEHHNNFKTTFVYIAEWEVGT